MLGLDLTVYLNIKSFVIVFGGTAAILAISAPLGTIKSLIRDISTMGRSDAKNEKILRSLYELCQNRMASINEAKHLLIDYSRELWEQGVEQNLFELLLEQRLIEINEEKARPSKLLAALGKYPPALGMLGTVIGMISLFANLNSETKDYIGPTLALAMTTTFYGLILSNLFITPVADRLFVKSQDSKKTNEMVFNMLLLINRNEPLSVVKNCHFEEGIKNAS